MDVVLIFDPEAPRSAVSLSVGVGPFMEDTEEMGLANLLEHLVIMVTFSLKI